MSTVTLRATIELAGTTANDGAKTEQTRVWQSDNAVETLREGRG